MQPPLDLSAYGLRDANAYVLIYDLLNPDSFEYISSMFNQISTRDLSRVPVVVVGNKTDKVNCSSGREDRYDYSSSKYRCVWRERKCFCRSRLNGVNSNDATARETSWRNDVFEIDFRHSSRQNGKKVMPSSYFKYLYRKHWVQHSKVKFIPTDFLELSIYVVILSKRMRAWMRTRQRG